MSVDCESGYLCNVIKLIGKMGLEKPWISDKVLVVDEIALHRGMYDIQKQNNMWAQLTMDLLYQNLLITLPWKLWCSELLV